MGVILALAGCVDPAPSPAPMRTVWPTVPVTIPPQPAPQEERCDRTRMMPYVGQSFGDLGAAGPRGPIRYVMGGRTMVDDTDPTRLSVLVDEGGMVTGLFCG